MLATRRTEGSATVPDLGFACVYAGVLRRLKGDERLIEAQRLPVALLLPPIAGVAGQTIDEAVMSPILRSLVAVRAAVALAQARRVDERQAQRVVVGLVRSVLAV